MSISRAGFVILSSWRNRFVENENVEFNEVRCKKLVLGDEETGVLYISMTGDEGNSGLKITQSEEDNGNNIIIGFSDGKPTIILNSSNKEEDIKGVIQLQLADEVGSELTISMLKENETSNINIGMIEVPPFIQTTN